MKQLKLILLSFLFIFSNCKSTTFKLLNSEETQTTISFENGEENSENKYEITSNNNNLKLLYNNNNSPLLELNSIENLDINIPFYINSSSIDIILNSKDSSFKYNNIEQFILYSIDTFEEKEIKWSNGVLSTCGLSNKYILGGYCHYSKIKA